MVPSTFILDQPLPRFCRLTTNIDRYPFPLLCLSSSFLLFHRHFPQRPRADPRHSSTPPLPSLPLTSQESLVDLTCAHHASPPPFPLPVIIAGSARLIRVSFAPHLIGLPRPFPEHLPVTPLCHASPHCYAASDRALAARQSLLFPRFFKIRIKNSTGTIRSVLESRAQL